MTQRCGKPLVPRGAPVARVLGLTRMFSTENRNETEKCYVKVKDTNSFHIWLVRGGVRRI